MDITKIKTLLNNNYIKWSLFSIVIVVVIIMTFVLFFSDNETKKHLPVDEKSTAIENVEVSIDLDKPESDDYEIIDNNGKDSSKDDSIPREHSESFLKQNKDYGFAPLSDKKRLKVLRAPAVGVVFLNFGINADNAKKLLDSGLIHKNSCIAINPYTDVDMEQPNIAQYDKVISIPFEPFSYPQSDPGEGVILTSMGKEQIEKRLDKFFSKIKGISGFVPIMGEKFFYSAEDVNSLFNIINKMGLIFINPSPSVKSIANIKSKTLGIHNINIDYDLTKRVVLRSVGSILKDATRMAKKTGFVIVAVDSNNFNHVKAIKKWLAGLRKEGFRTISPIKLCLLHEYKMIDGPYIWKNFYRKKK